ncbi:hypothetical protein B7P43_G02285 [Cryptotermes secundus]|uniref:Uncharacterized protein n=1 Tax=Cryptotermes secundus TaxID=105785 RepID=A0A2J7R575_9NEOP|nr:hypothetical protein B7P43_G02285 [Cryptotermes secundus]
MTAPKAALRFVLQVESDFYKITYICFDDIQLKSLYSNFTFVSGIGGFQVGFPRPSFIQDDFYPEISVDNLYTRNVPFLSSAELADKYIHVSNLQDYLICNDVHSKISWLQWNQTSIEKGYSLSCDVDEFRSTVSTLPEFSVSGLLIYVNICSSCSL